MPAPHVIPGFTIGHAHDADALTGCTVVLCPPDTVGGIDVRGGAASTRQADGLGLMHLVPTVHAVLLTGGSAFGLGATSGVLTWLEERGVGLDMRVARVPIVPTLALFDLALGRPDVRPDAALAYAACNAATATPPAQGSVGAGMGATVGKGHGLAHAMRGGLGWAVHAVNETVFIGALVAVNAFGDVLDRPGGALLAGARTPGTFTLADTQTVLGTRFGAPPPPPGTSWGRDPAGSHTVIGVVLTNAALDKSGATKLAQMAHDGLARVIRPAHTTLDGDAFIALASGAIPSVPNDVNVLGAVAAEAVAAAIVAGVSAARAGGGLPACADRHAALAAGHNTWQAPPT